MGGTFKTLQRGVFGNIWETHKTLPVNLKYKAPKPNTTNNISRIWTICEPTDGSSRRRGDIYYQRRIFLITQSIKTRLLPNWASTRITHSRSPHILHGDIIFPSSGGDPQTGDLGGWDPYSPRGSGTGHTGGLG